MHLIPSFLVRYLSWFRGRPSCPTVELPAESGNTQIHPPSTSPRESEHENVPAADRGKVQVPPSSSSLSFYLQPDQDSRTISYNIDLSASSSSWANTELEASSSSSTSSSTFNWEHDVFLSFRGEDTRHSFTDHLYFALNHQRGIDTFRDTEKLRRGKSISPELLKAIEESKFAVTVISINYATSSWCLDELAHIAECMKLRGLEVLPVFYHVEPSEVRKQTGDFGKGFAKLKEDFNDNLKRVNKWRVALQDISCLSGWHVTKDRSESEVIQEITQGISNILNSMSLKPDRELIGMDRRIKKVESRLDLRSPHVLAIGIWGMGGIGKSTLAKEVFNKIRDQFEMSGFVSISKHSEGRAVVELQKLLWESFSQGSNINIDSIEKGTRLLKKALRKKKVLIVLDNVDYSWWVVDDLAPGRPHADNSWGPGSRLIITTRDKLLLRVCGVGKDKIYEVEKLSDAEAFQLMSQKAFKKKNPPSEFVKLLKRFVKYASGLPLAHVVLGSYLSGRNVVEWSEALYRLDEDPDQDIFKVLRISYDGLRDTEKKIFLDIACFFNGEEHIRVKRILKSCGFFPEIGITDLIDKSLIKIERKRVWMHDLLQQLGWHIVRGESTSPGKRSRLWLCEKNATDFEYREPTWHVNDTRDVLSNNRGTKEVEGLFLDPSFTAYVHLNCDRLLTMETMPNLRLLKINRNVKFSTLTNGFKHLPNKLRFLEWHKCPLVNMPPSFEPHQLVEFKMPSSNFTHLWKAGDLQLSLEMLVLMDLSNCLHLIETPDFSKVPKLERLILENCIKLPKIHPTIGDHQHLRLLNLKGCMSLESLPQSISLGSLETFILSGCSKLKEFPKIVGKMKNFSELFLDGTAIRELPDSIQHLTGLILLNLSGCRNLRSLPGVLCSSLRLLKFLYLSLCSSLEELPENIGCLEYLQELDACHTGIRRVPESISDLTNLKLLCFEGCYPLLQLPDSVACLKALTTLNLGRCQIQLPDSVAEEAMLNSIGNLVSLQSLDLSENGFSSIPESIFELPHLTEISLLGCSKLQRLPKYPPKWLKNVDVRDCAMLTCFSDGWRELSCQNGLSIINCRKPEGEMFPELHLFPLEKLEELDLSNQQQLTKIPDLKNFPRLVKLNLEGCEKLSALDPTFQGLLHLRLLNLKGCADLESLPSISFGSLESLILSGCKKLENLPPLPICLKFLNLSGCSIISKLPENLWRFKYLEEIEASETAITDVPLSINDLKQLKVLSFSGCRALELPARFSDLNCLKSLNLSRCGLAEVPISIFCLSSLQNLDLSGNNIREIPNEVGNLSCLKRLDLSESKFESLPESISQLSVLTELHLLGCSKLQFLPKFPPFNLRQVQAKDCPLLMNSADTLTIWAPGRQLCFINCGRSDQEDVPKDLVEVLFPKYIKDRIDGKKSFEICVPHSRIPNFWSFWASGSSVEIPLPESNISWMGFALFVVFEILQKDSLDNSWDLCETICEFHTHSGHEKSLVFQNFINFKAGSYGLCCYEPREGKFSALFDNANLPLQASVTTKRADLKVRACGIHPIFQEDAAEFVQNLTYQIAIQHLDFSFGQHCDQILDEPTSDDQMELDHNMCELESPTTENQDTREELSQLYEGHIVRKKSFHLCFPVPKVSIPPWFFNHHAGDATICYITEDLLDDQGWVGLELYVIFTRHSSASSNGKNSFFFHVDLCAHDHQSVVMHRSLEIESCLGTSDQLVVLHVPRIHFQQQLNKCQGISALFRTVNQEMEVLVCGSRLVFEKNLKDLVLSLTVAAGTLGEHVLTQLCSQVQTIISTTSTQRSTSQVLCEQAPTSSLLRLQSYRSYHQENIRSGEFDSLLVHSKCCISESRDILKGYAAEEDITCSLDCDQVNIMVETLIYGSYSLQQWKRCLQILLQHHFKVANIRFNGNIVSVAKQFNPSSTYSIYFCRKEIPEWFKRQGGQASYRSRVGINLPPKLCDDNNWRGLVVCAALNGQNNGPTTSSVKLLCHLKSKDYCLNPIPMCCFTEKNLLKPFYRSGLVWLTYIPRHLLTEFNLISDVEARFYVNSPGLRVIESGVRILYRKEEEEFKTLLLTNWWISFFDNLPVIRQLVEDENIYQTGRTCHDLPMLEGHIKDFDRDLMYNAILPSNEIPDWFGCKGKDKAWILEIKLPAPSLLSEKNWIGLTLCASYDSSDLGKYGSCKFSCQLSTEKNGLSSLHPYEMSFEEYELLKYGQGRNDNGYSNIWVSYLPRRWFLHQLNDESVLTVSFPCFIQNGSHRFVYEHDVHEFKQLCIDLNYSVAEQIKKLRPINR